MGPEMGDAFKESPTIFLATMPDRKGVTNEVAYHH
jgi:hypothetical protein